MIVVGTSNSSVLVFLLKESLRDIEILRTEHSASDISAAQIVVDDSGRIFVLPAGQTKLLELDLKNRLASRMNIRRLIRGYLALDTRRISVHRTRLSGNFPLLERGKRLLAGLLGAGPASRHVSDCQFAADETKNVLYQFIDYNVRRLIRGVVYKQRIFVYDLGEQNEDFVLRCKIKLAELRRELRSYCRSALGQDIRADQEVITGIAAARKFEAHGVDLIVFLASGVRLFVQFERGRGNPKPRPGGGFRFLEPDRVRGIFAIKAVRFGVQGLNQAINEGTPMLENRIDRAADLRRAQPSLVPSYLALDRVLPLRAGEDPKKFKYHFGRFLQLTGNPVERNPPVLFARNWRTLQLSKKSVVLRESSDFNLKESLMPVCSDGQEQLLNFWPAAPERSFSSHRFLPYSAQRQGPWTFPAPPGPPFHPPTAGLASRQIKASSAGLDNPSLVQNKFVAFNEFAQQVYFPPALYFTISDSHVASHALLRPVDLCLTYLKALQLATPAERSLEEGALQMSDLADFFTEVGPLEFCACLLQLIAQANAEYFVSVPVLASAVFGVALKNQKEFLHKRNIVLQGYLDGLREGAAEGRFRGPGGRTKLTRAVAGAALRARESGSETRVGNFENLLFDYHREATPELLIVPESPVWPANRELSVLTAALALNFNFFATDFQRKWSESRSWARLPADGSLEPGNPYHQGISASLVSATQLNGSAEADKEPTLSILQSACFLYFARVLG